MFGGGYYRGTNILISGSPGTAKSTLASAFAEASCRRGERVLYVSFDENASELVRNMTSVNIQLQASIESGLLRVYSTRVEMTSAEELFMVLRELIHDHQPQALIIDPLTALVNAGGQHVAYGVAQRLLYATKAQGITVVGTRLLETPDITSELTPTSIATVADTWIHLAYFNRDGQRNRTLTIIKSRGMHHSTRVHELELSDEGITLADVHPPLQRYD
jgi:circadian clock protein KaiC